MSSPEQVPGPISQHRERDGDLGRGRDRAVWRRRTESGWVSGSLVFVPPTVSEEMQTRPVARRT